MPEKILVVEDNMQNRMLFKDVLEFHGYTVLEAADGAEGVRLALEHFPDLILMDIQMPGMNGVVAGKQLRADARTKGIKLLSLSSFSQSKDDEDFFRSGFDGYIEKPIDIRKLPQIIEYHLRNNKHHEDEKSIQPI